MSAGRDIQLDDTGDFLIRDGSVVMGDATVSNQRLLLLIEKGELKQGAYPAPGGKTITPVVATVGVRTYLNEENPQEMLDEITRRFSRDGMKVKKLEYRNGSINVDAPYV